MDYEVSSRIADDHSDTQRPNIVLIMTDQQTYNTLGCYGNSIINTPNIDRLASEGVVFERAYTTCPLCAPARASFFTSLPVSGTGSPVNDDDARMIALSDSLETSGDLLKKQGYTCGYFGKWHMGREDMAQHGFEDGWFVHLRNSYENWIERTGQFSFPEDLKGLDRRGVLPFELQQDTVVTDKSIEFIDKHKDDQFFCVCSLRAPHDPYIGPFDDLYPPEEVPLPETVKGNFEGKPFNQIISWARKEAVNHGIENPQEFKKVIARYWGLVHLVDLNVGRLLDTLDDLALRDNTLVMFAVDHGDMMGAQGLLTKGPFMYEETTRVPLILRYPAKVPAGKRTSDLVSLLDGTPTLLDYAEVPVPSRMQGRSLRSLINQVGTNSTEGTGVSWRDAVFIESYESYTQRCPIWNITTKDWKYNYYFGDIDELYDLKNDPHEKVNRAQDPGYRQLLFEMRERLMCWADSSLDIRLQDVIGLAGHTVSRGYDFRFDFKTMIKKSV